jgi:hypothetical protein
VKKPCNNCGECCLSITCALGQAIFLVEEADICPAIETANGLYYCGLISNTASYTKHLIGEEQWKVDFMHDVFVKLIGIGIGCTNGERTGEKHEIDMTLLEIVASVASSKE